MRALARAAGPRTTGFAVVVMSRAEPEQDTMAASGGTVQPGCAEDEMVVRADGLEAEPDGGLDVLDKVLDRIRASAEVDQREGGRRTSPAQHGVRGRRVNLALTAGTRTGWFGRLVPRGST